MRIIVLSLIVFFGVANFSQAQTQPQARTKAASATVSTAAVQTLSPKGYAACSSRKYNHAYGENTIIAYRQKEDKYLLKSSKFLKKDLDLMHIPIILSSYKRNVRDMKISCGADEYLLKPFSLEQLSILILKHFNND